MKPIVFSICLVLIVTLSCKKPVNNEQVCVTRTLTGFRIMNNTSQTIYIAAFPQSLLPVITWITTCSGPGIAAHSSILKPLPSGMESNDKLAVFWWNCAQNTPGSVKEVVLDVGQTDCK